MKTRLLILLIAISSIASAQQISTTQVKEIHIGKNTEANPCITPAEYQQLEKQCADNIKRLGITSRAAGSKSNAVTLFDFPLRAASHLGDCSYYVVLNYVDQDATSATKDYNCGNITYNGHAGTDIGIVPYPLFKMDNNHVEIIAAAPGTIVNKADGLFDKNCASGGSGGNNIVLQHADGSRSIYYHMKKNSLTSKVVGQTVAAGEFLGIVGSSGSSTTPHLHFEVWSGSTYSTRQDPYAGTCNTLNANTWWAAQKPYKERGLLKIQVNNVAMVLPACPTTETPNEDSCFALGGGTARFYRWIRNDSIGLVSNMRILNPDGSVFSTWTATSSTNYNVAAYSNTRTLPNVAGVYTYEVVFLGDTCKRLFTIASPSQPGNITGNGIICRNSSNTYSIAPVQGASAYTWTLPSGWSGVSTSNSITVSAGSFGGSISVTANNSCGASAVRTLSVAASVIDTSVTANGFTLNSNESGATYQWLNCPSMQMVAGANSQSYTPAQNGMYAVKVSKAGCSDTSACYPVMTTALSPADAPFRFDVFPNPSEGNFTIQLSGKFQNARVTMYDILGKIILEKEKVNTEKLTIERNAIPEGIYTLRVVSGDGVVRTRKLVLK